MTTGSPIFSVTPLRGAIAAGGPATVDVLVRLAAPAHPPRILERAPLSLALVIDRSGSMSGRPLAEAKRCAALVVDRLRPTDRCALVAYDNAVATLVASRPVGDRAGFREAIDGIHEGGSTNLHGGWLAGATALAPYAAGDGVSRVLLLSDGGANCGLTEPRAIFSECAALAATGVTTSTCGLGRGFNEALMQGMARNGNGNAYYGETAEDLLDPFQEELDLLGDLWARSAVLEVAAEPGVGVQVLNDLPSAGPGRWRLPGIAFASEAWAVVRLRVPAAALARPGSTLRLARFAIACEAVDGGDLQLPGKVLELPVATAAEVALSPVDGLVTQRAGELEAARLQAEAREAALRGDWDGVRRCLGRAKAEAAGNPWIAGIVQTLEELASRGDRDL
ncbi:MAG: VWA domain-containing protein, partial [Geminicoccaceae bacterium]